MENTTKIMMPVIDLEEKVYYPSGGQSGMLERLSEVPMETIQSLAEVYKGYELDSIELHVKGVAKSGAFTELIVGLSGEAGMKLTLKKKKDEE